MNYEDAVAFFAEVFRGKHHIPGKIKEVHGGWTVCMWGYLSTWDDNYLTRLVLCAHDQHIRVEVESAMRYLRISISSRKREDAESPNTEAHPTIGKAVEMWREKGHEERP